MRAFAKAMGDDMATSSAGYADPGINVGIKNPEGDEVLSTGF